MKRTFQSLDLFARNWAAAGLDDSDLASLEEMLMLDPTQGPAIRGTGGVRKIRFARPGMGKSSGVRVFYFDFDEEAYIVLMAVILKNQDENLSQANINQYATYSKILKAQISELNRRTAKIQTKGKTK